MANAYPTTDDLLAEPLIHWTYRAEGAANVAFWYSGTNPTFNGLLLRVRKLNIRHGSEASAILKSSAASLVPRDPLEFTATIMQALLGSRYVIPGAYLSVPTAFLLRISEMLSTEAQRPRTRQGDCIDLCYGRVAIMVDHALLAPRRCLADPVSLLSRSFCVEIKPKSTGQAIVGQTCRYCRHKILKAVSAECQLKAELAEFSNLMEAALSLGSDAWHHALAHVSAYCPADLYSGDSSRVFTALSGLVASPQNNFRVFVDGSLVYSQELFTSRSSGSHGTAQLSSMLMPYVEFQHDATCEPATQLCHILTAILSAEPILKRLRDLQLQGPSLQDAFAMFCSLASIAEEGLLHNTLNKFASAAPVVECTATHRVDLDPHRKMLTEFLVATTAKDCSILITFSAQCKTTSESLPSVNPASLHLPSGLHLWYTVSVVDLDPKPLSRIPHYMLQEAAIDAICDVYYDKGATKSVCRHL